MSSMRSRVPAHGWWPEMEALASDGVTRRSFLSLLGASMALAGLASCRWPEEPILPSASDPEGLFPGIPRFYATSMDIGGAAVGLLVNHHDGRPIKVEGNPLHPASLGATHVWAQASLLELYDPARNAQVTRSGQPVSWDAFAAFLKDRMAVLRPGGGLGLRFLCGATSSPSILAMRRRIQAELPSAIWHAWEPFSRENEDEGTKLVFGAAHRVLPDLAAARVVVSLDEDFLHSHPHAVRFAHDFAERRRTDPTCCLHVVEPVPTLTGTKADHRLAMPTFGMPGVAAGLARAILSEGFEVLAPSLERLADPRSEVAAMASALRGAQGEGLVLAGPGQAPVVHALVAALNLALGNVGKTVRYAGLPEPGDSLNSLVEDMRAGRVQVLVILGGNPVFDAPADLDFAGALRQVPHTVHLSLFEDETSGLCHWHLPMAHFLESWGDARAWDGTISVVQPMTQALHGGISALELLSMVLDPTPRKGWELVRSTFREPGHEDAVFEDRWRRFLSEGCLPGSAWPSVVPTAEPTALGRILARMSPVGPGWDLEVLFRPDARILDGRFDRNAWLQELPDPISGIAWDSAAWLSPGTAREMGLSEGDVVGIAGGPSDGHGVEAPVRLVTGMAEGCVALHPGRRANQEGGCDFHPLRRSDGLWGAQGIRVGPKVSSRSLCTVGNRFSSDQHEGIGLAVVGSAPRAEPDSPGQDASRWSMIIDLSACTGCGVCTIACQAENNIPVVGREQVALGREMHWIRVERRSSETGIFFLPVPCMHCEAAPCEPVCPVGATLHSVDGLNQMVYPRCVGARACSAACSFGVRRFNFLDQKEEASFRMVRNPGVTVRSRGVTEKCTYCIQRIRAVSTRARDEQRTVIDGEIVPACAQACPSGAILFGDLNDGESRVARARRGGRAFRLLPDHVGTERTLYLSRPRSPT